MCSREGLRCPVRGQKNLPARGSLTPANGEDKVNMLDPEPAWISQITSGGTSKELGNLRRLSWNLYRDGVEFRAGTNQSMAVRAQREERLGGTYFKTLRKSHLYPWLACLWTSLCPLGLNIDPALP